MSVADNQAYTLVVHLYTKEGEENINKVKAKLQEASQVYSKDRETLSWFVMQDHLDARKFTIVERYVNESSQKYHLENPYWQTFDPYVKPLLAEEMDLRRYNELDLSQEVKVVQNETLWNEVEEYQNLKDC
ncbi:uncharacterized protein SEPMUDRAFT_38442 [Sphaerulina musiva SO2202]|uniref:ABM domain-containing protein n=1 Tax=Sphaerulina musiva (strain SO2202) TaxID=692275 RepID=M3B512_SPHMS|nr:uncharacterized protein SEPMUDRAFT_38442 [Sphaerulina musiva SO2202]EMF14867.1 hypothetical protein SEPMUDRAFT_38442 [Sphaerulina musiva SO2202]